jgi:catechol 2,3-dioxygenase-like lactoylglutathione lyase family enzyme
MKMPWLFRLLMLSLIGGLTCSQAVSEPVPPDERTPVDIRRTTLVVRDIDKSLALYRDALGLKTIYDQRMGGGTGIDGKPLAPTMRLVLLRANDTFIGALGLLQRLTPSVESEPPVVQTGPVKMIMVINVADLGTRWPKIAATPHIRIETEPTRVEYPAPEGGVIPVMFSAVRDADGNKIELNQILGVPAGTTPTQPK